MSGIIVSSEIVAGVYTLLILAAILHQYRMNRNNRGLIYIWFVTAVVAGLFSDMISYLLEGSNAVGAKQTSPGCLAPCQGYYLFIKKMNYFDNEDINLLNVVGYLDACTCVSSIITVDIVERVCPSFEEANVFALTSLIREHNAQELYKQVTIITGKDAIRVLSLLLKDFRVAYKLKYFGSEEISAKRTMFASYPKELLCNCMNIIVSIISGIKNGYYSEDQSLLTACAQIMSAINMYETECIS